MYYRDLSCYRYGEDDDIDVFPAVKNIGWLDKAFNFEKGAVSADRVNKLREIIFLDLKNNEDKKNEKYSSESAINVHCMHIRGSAYKCNLCSEEKEILYDPLNLKLYRGTNLMKAGLNEVCIPALKKGEFYSFPTMLLHYITEHSYKPPKDFLEALDAFDLTVPYDIDKEQEEIDIVQVTKVGLDKYN